MTKLKIDKIQRIVISKRDEAAMVVEKIINSDVKEIVLSIPRFSKLVDSLSNFHLIKREADLLGKKVVIESVDDKAVELAGLAKLESVNPFFVKSRRQVSDIVVQQHPHRIANLSNSEEEKSAKPVKKSAIKFPKIPKLPSFRKTTIVIGLIAAFAILLMVLVKVLPRAEITLVTKKSVWNFNESALLDKSASEINFLKNIVPGQLFTQSRNLQLTFSASGKKRIEKKSSGEILIFNAYSSDPQPLVAQTRFLAPDGKIFRLIDKVTVPGAKIVDGKIVSSSIAAGVVADQSGDSYNIGPVSRFTIPGLKGSPKYESFYGQSEVAMGGGFIGEVGYPTPEDIQKAETELRKKLEDSLVAAIVIQIPNEFKVLDNARSTTFSNPVLNTDIDAGGNFGIFGEASMSILAFKESDLLSMLSKKLKADLGSDFEMVSFDLGYGLSKPDFKKGSITVSLKFSSIAARSVNIEELKSKIANKSEEDLKAVVFALPGLESARIALWPFWVMKVPQNLDKITVIIE